MADETTGAEALEQPVVAPAAGEAKIEPSEAITEQPSEAGQETAEAETGDDTPAPPKKKHWAHERIDELTRQRREAERSAAFWEAKAKQATNIDDLEYDDQIAERVLIRNRQEQADTAQESATSLAEEVFSIREDTARERYQDYDIIARNPRVPITPNMLAVIMDSELGPDIAYHLGKNPAEAAKIAAMPALRQAAELGKMEARFAAPKTLAKQPPAPVQPVSGIKAGGAKAPEDMSFTEYKAWREANP